jgi:hypothetical protein
LYRAINKNSGINYQSNQNKSQIKIKNGYFYEGLLNITENYNKKQEIIKEMNIINNIITSDSQKEIIASQLQNLNIKQYNNNEFFTNKGPKDYLNFIENVNQKIEFRQEYTLTDSQINNLEKLIDKE